MLAYCFKIINYKQQGYANVFSTLLAYPFILFHRIGKTDSTIHS